MTKLRDDLRGAFDKEQAKLGDVAEARHRLVHNALAARDVPASRGLQWAAGVAAVLIAAIVIVTFALIRAGSHSQVVPAATPTPRASVSPTPLGNLLGVPDSTPIITYGDPAKPDQVDGMTWDGKVSGKLPVPLVGTGNPANNLFATATDVSDRSGKTLVTGSFGAKFFSGMWADDEVHFCLVVPFDNPGDSGLATTLQLLTVGQAPRNVVKVGTLYNQTFVRVEACSVQGDRAIVVQSGGQGLGTAQYWVVQLSTGKIIWTHRFDVAGGVMQVVASRDGMYVAEDLDSGGPSGSTIYGPDGKQVAHLSAWVEAFSWDDSLAVIDDGYGSGGVQVVTWRDAGVVWSAPAGYGLLQAKPEPAGTEMAIWVAPVAQFSQQSQIGDLYVVSSNGKVLVHIANMP